VGGERKMNPGVTVKKAILDCCNDCDFNKKGYCFADFKQKVFLGCYYRLQGKNDLNR
jgi:hypothetical protein